MSLRPGAKHLSHFFQQLSTLYEAGVSITATMTTLSRTATHPALARAARLIFSRLEEGVKLSTAFESHPKCFTRMVIGIIEIGEESGTLDRASKELSRYFTWQYQMKKLIIAGFTYPMIQLALALAIVGFLLYVMPMISGPENNPFPENAARNYVIVIFAAIAGIILLWKLGKFFAPGRRAFHAFLARGPLISRFYRKIAVGRFSLLLHLMTSAGVGIVKAVRRAGASTGNLVFESAAEKVANELLKGKPLAPALAETGLFDHEYIAILQVGETTGKLDETTGRLAVQYRGEAENAIKGLITLLSFAIWAIVSGFIVFMIFLIAKRFYIDQINQIPSL